jgi:hypothetical protein
MNANYRRANGYRTEEVSLRPRGNTVTVDVPSDNPFEDEALAGATVATQASGGISQAPKRQQSRKIVYKGAKSPIAATTMKRAVAVKNAKKPLYAERGAGIFGLGDIAKRPTYAVAPRQQQRRGFMPGMGELGAVTELEYQQAKIAAARPPAETNFDTSSQQAAQAVVNAYEAEKSAANAEKLKLAMSSGVEKAAAMFTSDQQRRQAATQASSAKAQSSAQARIADAQARIADATSATERARAQTDLARAQTDAEKARAGASSSSTKWLVGGGVAVVALGVAAFLLLRRKNKKA